MADDDKKTNGTLRVIQPIESAVSRAEPPIPSPMPMRPEEDLAPIIQQLANDTELMQRFRSVVGSGDTVRGTAVINEIEHLARGLDSTITSVDASRIVVGLLAIVDDVGKTSQ